MELRHLRYFVAIGEEQHYGRAARRLRVAQPALSRQVQDLEAELGFDLFDRLPRGVRLNAAGKLFLEDARRDSAGDRRSGARAGQSGERPCGHAACWFHREFLLAGRRAGVLPAVPRAATRRRTPASAGGEQAAVRGDKVRPSGCGVRQLHARQPIGTWTNFWWPDNASSWRYPRGHPLTRLKKLRLRDLADAPFVWFPRRANPAFYDRMMLECYRGGLKSPRIVQEGVNEPTILSLVSTGMSVGWVLATARWRCPESVLILPVVDLNMPLTLVLAWKRDNTSPLLANFIAEVRRLPDVRAVNKG